MKYALLYLICLCSLSLTALHEEKLSGGENLSFEGKTYAVVVGISDYQDPGITDLRFADVDAKKFTEFLRSEAGGSVDIENIKLLINEDATMAKFAIALDWLWEVVGEEDQVYIYFSGHGDVEKRV